MNARVAALVVCLCLPLSALSCPDDQRRSQTLDRTVTIDGSEVVVVAAITVHNASRAVVHFSVENDAEAIREDVELAVTGVDDAFAATLTVDDDGIGNEGNAGGTLPCAEGVCEGEVTLQLTRVVPTDAPLALRLRASVNAELPETTPEVVIERFELSADEGVLFEE